MKKILLVLKNDNFDASLLYIFVKKKKNSNKSIIKEVIIIWLLFQKYLYGFFLYILIK